MVLQYSGDEFESEDYLDEYIIPFQSIVKSRDYRYHEYYLTDIDIHIWDDELPPFFDFANDTPPNDYTLTIAISSAGLLFIILMISANRKRIKKYFDDRRRVRQMYQSLVPENDSDIQSRFDNNNSANNNDNLYDINHDDDT